MKKDAVTDIFISNQLIWSWCYTSNFSFNQTNFNKVLKDVKFHWEIGGPNISMVSRTRERWSRKEFTDTLRIRASSACHLLKQSSSLKDTGMFIVHRWTKWLPYTESVLSDSVSCFSMPPFLGSLSGDRERRAMTASWGDGKGTSRELQKGQE